jgi:exopolysaccharide biosynthesis protein
VNPSRSILSQLLRGGGLLLILALLFVLAAPCARAEWIATSSVSEGSTLSGLIHRHIELKDSETGDFSALDLALFPASTKRTFRVIDNPTASMDLEEAMRQSGLAAGVNGGYFDPDFAPIGLRVIDGKLVRPLVKARLMTGVLFSTGGGSFEIVRVGDYGRKKNVQAAVQCGPLLVDGGHAVKGLDDTRSARRTFALVGSDRAALGFCPDASLAELATILTSASLAGDLKIQRALNLDGGSSSALWFKRSDGDVFSISEQKRVRDFIAITPR